MNPDSLPHVRYSVTLRSIDGTSRAVRVITNRGPMKAVYLATRGSYRPFSRWDALDIDVTDEGAPELDASGVPILGGYAIDRNEW